MPQITKPLTLNDLPAPPLGTAGWPWTEESKPLDARMPDGSEWPRISIVTPSYNQGQFIEETIRSVLLQGYPNLEYIIIDGGSTDESLGIIKKYERFLAYWISESDKGQPHAINKGFKKSTGTIASFLNSDDLYLPECLAFVATFFSVNPQYDFICAQTQFIDANSQKTKGFSDLFDVELNCQIMTEGCHIAQPSTFFRSLVFGEIGLLNENLHYCFDYDFWLRSFLQDMAFASSQKNTSLFRLHDSSKTVLAYSEGKFDWDFINIYQTALTNRKLKFKTRHGLRRGLGRAVALLFIHLEACKGIHHARLSLINIIKQTPEILLSRVFYKTFVVAFTPMFLRVIWRSFKESLCKI